MRHSVLAVVMLAWISPLLAAEPIQEIAPLWTYNLEGRAAAPVWANADVVIVADRRFLATESATDLIYTALQTDIARARWRVSGRETKESADSNAPVPVASQDQVFLLFAPGVLHTMPLKGGKPAAWSHFDFAKFYDARAPLKGYASAPLLYDGKLFLNPGAQSASLVALDPLTRDLIWTSPGRRASRADFIAGEFGGVKQLVGFDHDSLGGWAVDSGKRLWQIETPDRIEDARENLFETRGQLLVSTSDGVKALHAFTAGGELVAEPAARNAETKGRIELLAGRLALGVGDGVYALNLDAALRECWRLPDAEIPHAAFLALEDGRLCVFTSDGMMTVFDITAARAQRIAALKLCDSIVAQPAIASGRLFVCSGTRLHCFELKSLGLPKKP